MGAMPGVGGLLTGAMDPPVAFTRVAGTTNAGAFTNQSFAFNGGVRTGKWAYVLTTKGGLAATVSINGVGLTMIGQNSDGAGDFSVSVWISPVDIACDGTDTVNITRTGGFNITSHSGGVYSLDNLLSLTPVATSSSLADPATLDIAGVDGGVVLGGAVSTGTGSSHVWSAGVTKDYEGMPSGSNYLHSHASGAVTATGTKAVSLDQPSSTYHPSLLVSLR